MHTARTQNFNSFRQPTLLDGNIISQGDKNIVGSSGRKFLNKLAEQGALSFEDIMTCYNHRLRKTPEEIYEAVSGKLEEIDCLFLQTELEWLD